jgi:hypothetical protein
VIAAPERVILVTPNNLRRQVGASLGQPLIVEVKDRFDSPVPNVMVQFRVATGGGKVSSSLVRTDDQGRAAVNFTLGPDPGINSVVASVPGLPGSVTLTAIGTTEASPDSTAGNTPR